MVHASMSAKTVTFLIAAACMLNSCDNQTPQSKHTPSEPSEPATMNSPFYAAYSKLASKPSDEDLIQLRAAASLARLQGKMVPQDAELVGPLVELSADDRASVRATAMSFLGRLIQSKEVTNSDMQDAVLNQAIIPRMHDPDPSVRLEAVRAATVVQSAAATSALVTCLDDESSLVRFEALHALSARNALAGDAKLASTLERLLNDPDEQVRNLAKTIATPVH